jgi:4-hydroxy-3-polyprenylbenzoate decarboxylase
VKNVNPPMKAGRGSALLALATYSELKNIILVDEDVDIFDSDDILWAMTTRMQGDVSITTIPGIRGHQLIRPRRRNTARRSAEMASAARPFLTARSPGR